MDFPAIVYLETMPHRLDVLSHYLIKLVGILHKSETRQLFVSNYPYIVQRRSKVEIIEMILHIWPISNFNLLNLATISFWDYWDFFSFQRVVLSHLELFSHCLGWTNIPLNCFCVSYDELTSLLVIFSLSGEN